MMSKRFDEFNKNFKEAVTKIQAKSTMKEIGDLGAAIIKKRTRLGYGVSKNFGAKEKLKELSKPYVEQRQKLSGKSKPKQKKLKSPKNKSIGANQKSLKQKSSQSLGSQKRLSILTTPKKSNLTLEGYLLDSITSEADTGRATIKVDGKHGSDSFSNADLAKWVSDQGRPFLNLSANEIKQLTQYVSKKIKEILAKLK